MNRKGNEGVSNMTKAVIAIAVLILILGVADNALGGESFVRNLIDNIPGFTDTRTSVDGPELLRYDVISDTLEFYDGQEFVTFPTEEDVILNDKVLNGEEVKNAINEWYFDTIRWSYKGIGDLNEEHFYEIGLPIVPLFLEDSYIEINGVEHILRPIIFGFIGDDFEADSIRCGRDGEKKGAAIVYFMAVNENYWSGGSFSFDEVIYHDNGAITSQKKLYKEGGLLLTADNVLYHCMDSGASKKIDKTEMIYTEVINYISSVRDSILKGGADHTTLDVPYKDKRSDQPRTVTVDVEKRDGKLVMFLDQEVDKKISEPLPFNETMPEIPKELILDNYEITEYDQDIHLIYYNGEDTKIFIKHRYDFDSGTNQYFLRYNDQGNYNLGIPLDSEIVNGVFIVSHVEGYSQEVPLGTLEYLNFLNGKNVNDIEGAELL